MALRSSPIAKNVLTPLQRRGPKPRRCSDGGWRPIYSSRERATRCSVYADGNATVASRHADDVVGTFSSRVAVNRLYRSMAGGLMRAGKVDAVIGRFF